MSFGRHVVLQVDERPGARAGRGNLPAGLDVQRRIQGTLGNARRTAQARPSATARLRPRPPPLFQSGSRRSECAVARAGAALGLDAGSRHETGMGRVIHRTRRRTASADGREGSTRPSRAPDRKRRGGASAGRSGGATNAAFYGTAHRRRRPPHGHAAPRPRVRPARRRAARAAGLRVSASTGTSIPASTSSRTVRYVELLLVTATARFPGSHRVPAERRQAPRWPASPRDDRCRRTPAGVRTHRLSPPRAAPGPSTFVRRSRIARETVRRP